MVIMRSREFMRKQRSGIGYVLAGALLLSTCGVSSIRGGVGMSKMGDATHLLAKKIDRHKISPDCLKDNKKIARAITPILGKKDDKEYFDYLFSYIDKKIKKKPYYRVRGRGLRLTIYSKLFYSFITKDIGIPERKAKRTSGIPKNIKANKKFLIRFIRGVFDTDGTVFTSDKKGSSNYPTLEISNSNLALVTDIDHSLERFGFRVHTRKTRGGEYKVSIYGKEMLRMWNDVISSSNPHKRKRMESILECFC